jgi:hypothetical protein
MMQHNALLIGKILLLQKVGVTNPPPLQTYHPQDSGNSREQLGVIYSELLFMFPHCFILGVVTPLYFTHLDDLTVSHSLCGIQNLDRPLTVYQITS